MQFDDSLPSKDDDLSTLLSKAQEVLSAAPPKRTRPRPYATKENAALLVALMGKVDKLGINLALNREIAEETEGLKQGWTTVTAKLWACQVMALVREQAKENPEIPPLLASVSVTYNDALETILIKKKP